MNTFLHTNMSINISDICHGYNGIMAELSFERKLDIFLCVIFFFFPDESFSSLWNSGTLSFSEQCIQ